MLLLQVCLHFKKIRLREVNAELIFRFQVPSVTLRTLDGDHFIQGGPNASYLFAIYYQQPELTALLIQPTAGISPQLRKAR